METFKRVFSLLFRPRDDGGAESQSPSTSELNPNSFIELPAAETEKHAPRPVAILFGAPHRKAAARCLPEYRVVFFQGRLPDDGIKLDQFGRDVTFIVWNSWHLKKVEELASRSGIPVYQLSEGFQSRTRAHTDIEPCALLFDKSGAYYDSRRPSHLEYLLNYYDFEKDSRHLKSAGMLLKVLRDLKIHRDISRTARPIKDLLQIKLTRRILVIAQLEQELSVRYCLAGNASVERLIELARTENPTSEIVVLQPQNTAQFGRIAEQIKAAHSYCTIIPPEFVPGDVFPHIDHVYTISSLAGYEAILHGLPVTVIGAPFYAGWGLTDDRMDVPRRRRRLTLDQIFCVTHLLYPRFADGGDDLVVSGLALIFKQFIERRVAFQRMLAPDAISEWASWVAASPAWPMLLKQEYLNIIARSHKGGILSIISLGRVFAQCGESMYKLVVACSLAGRLRKTSGFNKLLTSLRAHLSPQMFGDLLSDLWEIEPSPDLLLQSAWLAEELGDTSGARDYIINAVNWSDGTHAPNKTDKYNELLYLAQFELRAKRLENALPLFRALLLRGHITGDVLSALSQIAELRFEFAASMHIMRFCNHFEPSWKGGRGYAREAQAANLVGDAPAALEAVAMACKFSPRSIEVFPALQEVLTKHFGALPYAESMLAATELHHDVSVIGRARALISAEKPHEAEKVLLAYKPKKGEDVIYAVTLLQSYGYQLKIEEARSLCIDALKESGAAQLFSEGLKLAILSNEFSWGRELLRAADEMGINVPSIHRRKIAFGSGDIHGAYATFRQEKKIKNLLSAYLGKKYAESLADLPKHDQAKCLIVAMYGPGDEIRFSSLYREMKAKCGKADVTFTCDPRIYSLLQRHYADLRFAPVHRVRNLAWLDGYTHHNALPGSELHAYFDNEGWRLASEADGVTLVPSALADVIDDRSSFKGGAYLVADPEKVTYWKERLMAHAGRPLIGLSWRSSLNTYSRNQHYLDVTDLEALFSVSGVTFVNLQYDDCAEELAYLDKMFPGRIINFPEIDQYNDLDGVAALMMCLDIVVSPATTVVELAGALGRPTIMLSNSTELHWRKIPGTNVDSWHNSTIHAEGSVIGDKKSVSVAAAALIGKMVFCGREVDLAV